MSEERSSTLLVTERAMQPLVLAVTYGSCALALLGLGLAFGSIPVLAWLACAVPALALEASNLRYRHTHALTTIGMMPVALFALVTPCVACLCIPESAGPARVLLAVLLACLLVLLLYFCLWFWRLRRTYSSHPQVEPTASIIILGGAIKNGAPCTTLARRLDEALRCWEQSPMRTLVPSGGPTPDGSTTEADAMARYLQTRGVDPAALVLETRARNTRENIAFACRLLDEQALGGQRCVVSSDYHLWRALREARRLGIELTPIAAPTPKASALQQWCREVLTISTGR